MDPQTHGELLAELRQLRERVSDVESYLEYQQSVSRWRGVLGRCIHYLCLGIFVLQYFPWIGVLPLISRATGFGTPAVLTDGRLNPQHAVMELCFFVCGVGNAVALACIAELYTDDTSRVVSFAYVTFFVTVLALNIANTRVRIAAGTDAANAEDRFSANMLKFFGVRAQAVTHSYHGTEAVIFLLVSACPTLVVVFCYKYFQTYRSSYTLECKESWTDDSAGFCNPLSGVCCRAVRSSFDFSTFLAYLVGNVLGGYKFVQYTATLEVAYLTHEDSIQGGAAFARGTKYSTSTPASNNFKAEAQHVAAFPYHQVNDTKEQTTSHR